MAFCVLRRRKRRDAKSSGIETTAEELGSESVVEGHNDHIAEMTTKVNKTELASPVSPVELWSPVVRAELPCEEKGRLNVNELDGSR